LAKNTKKGVVGRIFQEKGGKIRVLTLTERWKKCIYENMNNCSYIKNAKNEVSMDVLFELSEFFKFFGDTTRIRIIHLMLSGEISVNDIAEKLNLEQSVVSHQLRILRTANLVKPRRDGRKMFYSLDDEHIGLIFNTGLTHILHKKGK
jgi:DNA-binding transcriptional ArsR family regulator